MIDTLPTLAWDAPGWLVLALVPWLLTYTASRSHTKRNLERLAERRLWPWLITAPRAAGSRVPRPLHALAWALVALAATQPYLLNSPEARDGPTQVDVAVILDISPSMRVADVRPTRLERAKLELQQFSQHAAGHRVALVAFSGGAYVALPFTYDRDMFLTAIAALEPELSPQLGSNLSAAMTLANSLLTNEGRGSGAVLLVTDGEQHGAPALAAAERLRDIHAPLFVIGIGTPQGGPVLTATGQPLRHNAEVVHSRLRRDTLRAIADAAGGTYLEPQLRGADWDGIVRSLEDRAAHKASSTPREHGDPLYPWLLAPALFVFLFALRRDPNTLHAFRSTAAPAGATPLLVLVALAVVALPTAHAWPWDARQARELLDQGRYPQAAAAFRDLGGYTGTMGEAAAAYRQGDWEAASRLFQEAARSAPDERARARALYNRGTTLARAGDLPAAREALSAALQLWPNYPHAALNLSIVNALMDQPKGKPNPDIQRSPVGIEPPPRVTESLSADSDSESGTTPEFSPPLTREGRPESDRRSSGDALSAEAPEDSRGALRAERMAAARLAMESLRDDVGEVLRLRFALQATTTTQQDKPW